LQDDRKKFEEERNRQDEILDKKLKQQLGEEKKKIQAKIKSDVEEEHAEQYKAMQDELKAKSDQLKEYNKTKGEIERLKREKDGLQETIEAESEKRFTIAIQTEKEKIQKHADENSKLKLAEREKIIEQLNTQLQEAQRKAEQGSMQLQGEVQELAIEDWLRERFPLDTIEEIKKGERGADCLQTVNTRTKHNCGRIYYESKRAKSFGGKWIEKFKNDIREKKVEVGVLVTEVMPADMDRMGLKEGVWICTFEEFRGLCQVLRESIIMLNNAKSTQENKGDKMHMLYDFLTSNEFKMQVEGIVEGFSQMKMDLDREKRAMHKIWKDREKQIEKVLLNTANMYGSIKGIVGRAIPTVQTLELPGADEGVDEKDPQ